jgi:membrane-bound metal-dependent hydrolase YbcI (DUF457 family)
MATWLLTALLILSNILWAYKTLDTGITLTYMSHSLEDHTKAIKQIEILFPLVAHGVMSKERILKSVTFADDFSSVFEKDGFTWVGQIGIRFDRNEKVDSLRMAWE